jgi:hypothetical protein
MRHSALFFFFSFNALWPLCGEWVEGAGEARAQAGRPVRGYCRQEVMIAWVRMVVRDRKLMVWERF